MERRKIVSAAVGGPTSAGAIAGAEAGLAGVLRKAKTWERINSQSPVNERQRKVINRLLDGLEGKLSTSKSATLAKCSPDKALRDIGILLERGILIQDAGGGRSTSCHLAAWGHLRHCSNA